MVEVGPEWAQDRLPDGSVSSHLQFSLKSAEEAVANEALVASARKAAELFTSSQLVTRQLNTAQQLKSRFAKIAEDSQRMAETSAQLARQKVAEQELADQDELIAARAEASKMLELSQASALSAADNFELQIASVTDLAILRKMASRELASARLVAGQALVDAQKIAEDRLAAAARLAAGRLIHAEAVGRVREASEISAAQTAAAEELLSLQESSSFELAAIQTAAAEELIGAAKNVAQHFIDMQDASRQQLGIAERQLRRVMDVAGIASCTASANGQLLRVNNALCEMAERDEQDLLSLNLTDLAHPNDRHVLLELLSDLNSGERESARISMRFLTPDSKVIWGDFSIAASHNIDGAMEFNIVHIVDITERVNLESSLALMATHDSLTGLANRAALTDDLGRALLSQRRSGRLTAVLSMDLDHFKNVNDSLGHAAGDELLIEAAERIKTATRGGDLVARPGGDEFVIVMRDLNEPEDAIRSAWRLVQQFRQAFPLSAGEVFTTATIGIAIASNLMPTIPGGDDSDIRELLHDADAAMYAAKAAGRDRVSVYDVELQSLAETRFATEIQLRRALEQDQLLVFYQPEIDLTTGSLTAVEALLRWQHPDGSLWNASEFIDIAENTGLIKTIGDWALRQACIQAATWSHIRPDHPIIVRVNKSAYEISDPQFLHTLDDALSTSGLDPARLCIELTESSMIRESSIAAKNIAGIHSRGISLAIDDFGTGFASLTYLRLYPMSVIKIDRSFVKDIEIDKEDHAIISSIINLGSVLGMTVTAEGVESLAQARLLREAGCQRAQGLLYSKAVPAKEIDSLIDFAYQVA